MAILENFSSENKNALAALENTKAGFAETLVVWYKKSLRDLPWRHTTDPYAIWVSEIMLQQTQVTTVIPYYQRFLKQFPNIQALAEAPEGLLLKAWEGLGYYARVRNLQRAAKTIMELHNGQFPTNFEAVVALTGIGKSTAGAILTFACGQAHPLLDGNVKRVLARLFAIEEDPGQPWVQNKMWELSDALLKQSSVPHLYNQAIMELGATVCVPQKPQCLFCPVRHYCQAASKGIQHNLPKKSAKKEIPHFTIGVGVIWNDQRQILIQKRPNEGLLGGLWEFPGGKQEPHESLTETVQREIMEELGVAVQVNAKITQVKHAYTHFRITMHAYHCTVVSGEPSPKLSQKVHWARLNELEAFAFPKANNKILDVLKKEI